MDENSWLIELKKLTQLKLFQSKSNSYSNIHILGLSESTDIRFDYLFIVGMDSKSWPKTIVPNPYLPYKLQNKYNMPQANIERSLDFYKRMTKNFLNQATNIYLSFSQVDDQNQVHIPSPLFSDYIIEPAPKIFSEYIAPIGHTVKDNYLSKVDNEEKLTLTYGVSIFKNMAECPYRAALIHRLKLMRDPQYRILLDPKDKGKIIHQTLEYIWRDIKNLKNLQTLSLGELKKVVKKCVSLALKKLQHHFVSTPIFIQISEQKRLRSLIEKWLHFEAKRIKNFSILALEKSITIELLGVKVSLRIDRIDRFDNGQTVIIDYKTSRIFKQKNWLNAPILDPQLPLYAIFEDANFIAIGLVNGYNAKFESLSTLTSLVAENLPKVYASKTHHKLSVNFEELKNYWRHSLNKSMKDFLKGNILITPSSSSCHYCTFGLICRQRFNYQHVV